MNSSASKSLVFIGIITITILLFHVGLIVARKRHVINFRSPNLYPEGLTWDPVAQHFVVGSLHHRSIRAVSDAGIVETLISDPSLPPNVTVLGLAIDSINRRLLAVINAMEPLPPFNALAAYDLRSRERLFLAPLTNDYDITSDGRREIANDVVVDFDGNAFVTNSASNFIWKVTADGSSSIFSRSPVFTSQPFDPDHPYSFCGLNGIAYISKGYFLVVQSNSGKMFKVNAHDGKARLVSLDRDLTMPDGIAVRSDGDVVVVSTSKAWLLKSDDSWGRGVVYEEIALEENRFPTSVAVRGDNRAYVLYGHVDEGIHGKGERELFGIEEMEFAKDGEEDYIWTFVLVGFGLAYFMYWRFQMGALVKNMNKKTA